MSTHVSYTTDIPPLPPGGRRRRPASSSATRRGYCEQISTRHGGHAAVARHPRPRGRRLRARAPTTRSPTSTTSRPTTPTPGCRCGSPATAGRTSIPPRGAAGQPLARAPPVEGRRGGAGPFPWVRSPWSCGLGRRGRARPVAPVPPGDVGGPSGAECRAGRPAGRPAAPLGETLAEYATILDDLAGSGSTTWGRLAPSGRRAPTGVRPRRRRSAPWRTRRGTRGSARADSGARG